MSKNSRNLSDFKQNPHTLPGSYYYMPPSRVRGIQPSMEELVFNELTHIRDGISSIKVEVSALSQDVKAVASTQNRHETWLTKIDGDVTSLRGFPQKIDSVESSLRRIESDVDESIKSIEKDIEKSFKEIETRLEKQQTDISDLKTYKTTETSKNQGLMKFITVSAVLVSRGSTVLAGLFWLFTRL